MVVSSDPHPTFPFSHRDLKASKTEGKEASCQPVKPLTGLELLLGWYMLKGKGQIGDSRKEKLPSLCGFLHAEVRSEVGIEELPHVWGFLDLGLKRLN